MGNLYYVGFNGYNQCPNKENNIINDWNCIPLETITDVCCTHRFIIIEVKKFFLLYGVTDVDSQKAKTIPKPAQTGSFASSDEFLIASDHTNLWRYSYKDSQWSKLSLNFSNQIEEDIWSESNNQIVKLSFREDINNFILLLSNGSIWFFSKENNMQLLPLSIPDKVIDLVSGLEHSLILTESGCVLSFGNGSRGQLGNGSLNSTHKPVQIAILEGLKVVKIAAGYWHSCAVTDSGDLCSWGWNNYGQVAAFEGKEELGLVTEPYFVDIGSDEENVVDVSCGSRHTIAKLASGDLYATGWNAYRQLGVDTSDEKVFRFTKVRILNNQNRKLICGPWYSVLFDN